MCDLCTRQFDTIGALGGHKRFCDSGTWRCGWCEVRSDECSGKGPGPDGPKTLCSACSARFRAGHTAPPLRDSEGNFLCDSCNRAFVSMGALGGHRRFCGQLSTAIARVPELCDDSLLTADDGGAAVVALPDRPASRLPAELHASVLSSFDFATYFFKTIVPAATMTEPHAASLKRKDGESALPPPPLPPEMAAFDPAKHLPNADAAKPAASKKRKKKSSHEEDLSSDVRQMLRVVQAATWTDWEAMFSCPPNSDPPPVFHALHLISVHLLLVDLLEPNKITAGVDFCARLGEASRRLLGGCTLCPFTWPELLRMVLLARSVAQAPKKRAAAMNAMLSSGHGSAYVAFAASVTLGGMSALQMLSVAPSGVSKCASSSSAAVGDGSEAPSGPQAEEDEGEVMNTLGDVSEWSPAIEALENVDDYSSLGIEMRCLITECVVQLLSETTLCSRFFEATTKAYDKLQDLKRTEYKNRNAQIEAEEQAKLAAKYNIARPLKLSHDRTGARESAPKVRGASNGEGGKACEADGEDGEADGEGNGEGEEGEEADAAELEVLGTEPSAEDSEGRDGGRNRKRDVERRRKRSEQVNKAAQHVKRGDLDQMRIRKDELRKQLDEDFVVLAGRIGRLRQEPIGLDRDRREYMILGGPAEGQQPGADHGRLLIRERPLRGPDGKVVGEETWRCIRCGVRGRASSQHAMRPRGAKGSWSAAGRRTGE